MEKWYVLVIIVGNHTLRGSVLQGALSGGPAPFAGHHPGDERRTTGQHGGLSRFTAILVQSSQAREVQIESTMEQLVGAIRQLEPEARSEIAKALMETVLDARMAAWIKSLATKPPAEDPTDMDILAEVNAVRAR